MRIGLLGFGVVGRGVYDLTQERSDMDVVKVLCLEDITLPDAEVTKDFQSILNDDTIDTVIEAMGGLHPAYEFVRAAMEAGKHIVSSNKALVASFSPWQRKRVSASAAPQPLAAALAGSANWSGLAAFRSWSGSAAS